MQLQNAIKRLNKQGYRVESKDDHFYEAILGDKIISFSRNGRSEEVIGFNVRRKDDVSDSMRDYFAGTMFSTLKSALLVMSNL